MNHRSNACTCATALVGAPVLTVQLKQKDQIRFLYLSSLREARAFNKLRRYHTRPSRFNWGPENVHFWKIHFRDLYISARISFFCVLRFSLRYLKTAQKKGCPWKFFKFCQKKIKILTLIFRSQKCLLQKCTFSGPQLSRRGLVWYLLNS